MFLHCLLAGFSSWLAGNPWESTEKNGAETIFKTSVNGVLFKTTWFGKRLCYNHSVVFALVFYSTSALFAATRRLTPSH